MTMTMTTTTRVGLATVAAFFTAVPVSFLASGAIWAFLEGTLHYGCFRGRGGEEGDSWICGDGMTKVLPSVFITGAIFIAFFCCWLALFSLGSGPESLASVYSIVAIASVIPSCLWILTEARAALVYLDPFSRDQADFVGGIYGISLIFLAAGVAAQLATCLIRSHRVRLILIGFVVLVAALSIIVAPV